jgi:type IV pilus assembly protein PilB
MVSPRKKTIYIGQLLLKLNMITAEQLKEATDLQGKEHPPRRLGEILMGLGFISWDDLYYALALQSVYPHIELSRYKLNKEIIEKVPRQIAQKYKLIPLDLFGSILTIGMVNPLDQEGIEAVEEHTNLQVRVFVIHAQDLSNAFDLVYK